MESPTSKQNHDHGITMSQPKTMTLPLAGPSSAFSTESLLKKPLCGLGFCYPLWLQRFATPKWFLATISLFVLFQSMMVSGITSSVITTIEKRYGLRSAESGLVVSSFDIGSLIVVVFISYFGGRGHRARWVAFGSIGVALGAALFSLPQFLSSPYQPPNLSSSDSSHDILCFANGTNSTDAMCETQEANSLYLFLFVISNVIIGIGSTPIYTLGSTFIYDNVPRDDASVYVSILYAIGAVGPAAGYLLGGFFLNFYVDLGVSLLHSDDPRFVGAWWLGYLVCAGFILLVSVLLLMFPRKLQQSQTTVETPVGSTPLSPVSVTSTTETEVTMNSLDTSVINFGANLKELPKAFFSLLTNGIFMCVTFAATLEFSIVTAFLTFVPKYLQTHFGSDTVDSSIITGAILVPSAGSGILLGGYIIKRLRLNLTGCAQTALLSNLLSLMLFISVFFISCDMGKIVGINVFPPDPVTGMSSSDRFSSCNSLCTCDGSAYQPLCHDGLTYFNPCFAGCSTASNTNPVQAVYENCNCLPLNAIPNASVQGIPGECDRNCNSALIPFLVCLFLVTMATVCAHTPSVMVTYRCVKGEERAFAAGIQFLFFRALAYIPAPIYFGVAIDHACLIWGGASDQCMDSTGSCMVYDTDKFRYIFFGVALTCKVFAAIFMFLSWLLCRREYSQHTHTTRWRRIRRRKHLNKIYKMKQKLKSANDEATTLPQITSSATSELARSLSNRHSFSDVSSQCAGSSRIESNRSDLHFDDITSNLASSEVINCVSHDVAV